MPYKAHEAAAYGVPMVVTPIIRDQLGWTHGKDCLVASDARQFADNCIKLFSDGSLWNTVRENALRRVSAELNSEAFGANIANILSVVAVDGLARANRDLVADERATAAS
jgi:glycosyltransferase involved in cell wall biosynthesis